MAVATGYLISKDPGWNTQQVYRVARRVLDSSKLKFGGFDYNPVITKIPSGYVVTGAYIRQVGADNASLSGSYRLGLCDFDNLGNRTETVSTPSATANMFVAVYDTGEFIILLPGTLEMHAMELLDPVSLNPIGFMVWQSKNNSAVFATQDTVTQGSISVILPEPIRVGNTVNVSRVYFVTPLGLAVTRHIYSANSPSTFVGMSVQVGSSKFIQVGSYLIDVTDEV
jgi:hypothetical protein